MLPNGWEKVDRSRADRIGQACRQVCNKNICSFPAKVRTIHLQILTIRKVICINLTSKIQLLSYPLKLLDRQARAGIYAASAENSRNTMQLPDIAIVFFKHPIVLLEIKHFQIFIWFIFFSMWTCKNNISHVHSMQIQLL